MTVDQIWAAAMEMEMVRDKLYSEHRTWLADGLPVRSPGWGRYSTSGFVFVATATVFLSKRDTRGWVPFLSCTLVSCCKYLKCKSLIVSDSLRPQGLQHARLPCPSPTPGACSDSCPLSRWCHPTISSSVIPYCTLVNSSKHWVDQKVHLGFQYKWMFWPAQYIHSFIPQVFTEYQLHTTCYSGVGDTAVNSI